MTAPTLTRPNGRRTPLPPPPPPPTRADWRDRAACADDDPELWFARGHRTTPGGRCVPGCETCHALTVCRGCPVTADSLATALAEEGDLDASGRHGIRGVFTPRERARATRERSRT